MHGHCILITTIKEINTSNPPIVAIVCAHMCVCVYVCMCALCVSPCICVCVYMCVHVCPVYVCL